MKTIEKLAEEDSNNLLWSAWSDLDRTIRRGGFLAGAKIVSQELEAKDKTLEYKNKTISDLNDQLEAYGGITPEKCKRAIELLTQASIALSPQSSVSTNIYPIINTFLSTLKQNP